MPPGSPKPAAAKRAERAAGRPKPENTEQPEPRINCVSLYINSIVFYWKRRGSPLFAPLCYANSPLKTLRDRRARKPHPAAPSPQSQNEQNAPPAPQPPRLPSNRNSLCPDVAVSK